MLFYICCTQEENECPRQKECRRYLNANEGTSWALFKYMCTEENDYHLFMERDDTDIVVQKEEDNKEINEQDS